MRCASLLLVALLTLSGCLSGKAGSQRLPGGTGIVGTVRTMQGEAVAGAYVHAYRSARTNLRGPADFEARTDAAGRYFLDLVEGRYHLVARHRRDGSDAGPLQRGDAWAVYPRNPVEVVPGYRSVAPILVQRLTGSQLMRTGTLLAGDTGFRGRVVDSRGVPVAGAFVLGYDDGDRQRPPDHTAPVTAEDGLFELYVPGGGRYCLAVRTKNRGQPDPEELYGIPDNDQRGCFSLDDGEILSLTDPIVLRPFVRR